MSLSSLPNELQQAVHNPDYLRQVYEVLFKRERVRRTVLDKSTRKILKPDTSLFYASKGLEAENILRNRYADIIPYDRNLVELAGSASHSLRYVNASWIREPSLSRLDIPRRTWIAAQGPLPETCHDFLRILLQDPSSSTTPSVIVMLTGLVEGGRTKCARYWPETVGHATTFRYHYPAQPSKTLGLGMRSRQDEWGWKTLVVDKETGEAAPIEVEFVSSQESESLRRTEGEEGWRTNKLSIGYRGQPNKREVHHLEYLGWVDHGVPSNPQDLLDLISEAHRLNKTTSSARPILVHCSAGVGRTGTFIATSSILPLLPDLSRSYSLEAGESASELGELEVKDDLIAASVDAIRDQRCSMVQTFEQLQFVYACSMKGVENAL